MAFVPSSFARRTFLRGVVALGGTAIVDPAWFRGHALAGPPLGLSERILVNVFLGGGNDGLNTVAPAENGAYLAARGGLAVTAANGLPVGGGLYLHPSLTRLRARYDVGDVAFVHGVGDPLDDHSHFTSTARWMAGRPGNLPPTTGWLGRYLDVLAMDDLAGVHVGWGSVPLYMKGAAATAVALPSSGGLLGSNRDEPYEQGLYNTIEAMGNDDFGKGQWANRSALTTAVATSVAAQVQPAFANLVNGNLRRNMQVCAQLINVDVGVRILGVEQGGYDTHDAQAANHTDLLADLDESIDLFFTTLAPQFRDRVTMFVFSEFGRRVEANDGLGTDHGTANTLFVIGQQVRGGHHGVYPSVTDLDNRGDLHHHVDFRQVYATLLGTWLGSDDASILGASLPKLDLFVAGSGAGNVPPVLAYAGGYAPVLPNRVLDTRDGTGVAAAGPLGDTTTIDVGVLGVAGVPATGVGAVVLNVTSTQATRPSFVTVWPTGEGRPTASSLNTQVGEDVPNLVIAKVGTGGKVSMYNNAGQVHLVADAVGWFPTGQGCSPLTPARLLDTRTGTGLPHPAALGPGGQLDLAVLGMGGVPASGVNAVVLNVTSTEATNRSFITVWPTGQVRPTASSLNTQVGEDVPNLVIAKVGDGGRVSLFNASGAVHLVADVVGYFADGSGYTALTPARLIDTREGFGIPLGSGRSFDLTVTGVGGAPASGVAAVALNVTSTQATARSFVTVWPTGEARPNASSLNTQVGQDVPNLVIAKVGTDGKVSLYNNAGNVHLIADLVGWFGA